MIKPRDYDQAESRSSGSVSQGMIPAGGHGAVIHKAEVKKDEFGERMFLYFDIQEGSEWDNYYSKKYAREGQFSANPQWKGVFRQAVYKKDSDETNPYFKGMVSAIEDSNNGFRWNFDELTLKGKKVGIVFREKEFKGTDGAVHTTSEPLYCCDIKNYDSMPIPKKKELAGL